MNILVTGKNGRVGHFLQRIIYQSKNNYFFTSSSELDITDKKAVDVFVQQNNIKVIINAAAYTNVEEAEKLSDTAYSLNSDAVDNLACAIRTQNGYLIHISTDYVYSSLVYRDPFKESEQPNPRNQYGLSKLCGEQKILASGCHYLIIRTSWLYSEYGKNIVTQSYDNILTCRKVAASVNHVGSPTYIGDLAQAIYEIVEEERIFGNDGIYNFANRGKMSLYDIYKFINIKKGNICILSKTIINFEKNFICPGDTSLDSTLFVRTFGINIRSCEAALDKTIFKYEKQLTLIKIFYLKIKQILIWKTNLEYCVKLLKSRYGKK